MSDSEDEDFDLEFDDNHIYLEKSKELYTIYYPEEVANLMLKIIDELKDVLKAISVLLIIWCHFTKFI